MVYDAVVIGAGPAGSSTAYHLASRGYHVLLLDKKRFPRNKVCGDALTPRAVTAILNMGLSKIGDGRPRISGVRFVEHRSNSDHVSPFVDEQPHYGLVITRHELDQLLCKQAIAAGTEFWSSATVLAIDATADPSFATIHIRMGDDALSVRARFAVIAEGSVGTLARTLRRRPLQAADVGFAIRQYFHIDSPIAPLFEFHFPATLGERSVAGYGWVFPVSDSLLNIGAGCVRGRASGGKIPVNEVYAEFIERLRGKGRLAPMSPCSPLSGAAVRLGLAPEEMVDRRTLVVGDAAALVNPFTGEASRMHSKVESWPLVRSKMRCVKDFRKRHSTPTCLVHVFDGMQISAAPYRNCLGSRACTIERDWPRNASPSLRRERFRDA
jgi:geranylgeranyl reductase family protein